MGASDRETAGARTPARASLAGAAPDAVPVVRSVGRAQRHPHGAVRVELPGPAGPLAALRIEPDRAAGAALGAPAVAVLVPGWSGSKEDFAPLIDPLAAGGIGVLALDLPGQYESPGSDDEDDYRTTPLGAVVGQVVDAEVAAGRRVLLLGHSYGGLVARAAVLAGAPVRGLTLMSSGPGELPMGRRRTQLDIIEPVLRRRGMAAFVALREETGDGSGASAATGGSGATWGGASEEPEVVDLLRRRLLASSVAGLLGMGHGLRSEPDRVAELVGAVRGGALACLVVCGLLDDAWPAGVQRTMADRLEAEFAAVPGAAHAPNVENPDALLDVLVPTWRTWLMEDLLG